VRKFLEHHGLRTPPAPPPSAMQDALKTARRGLEPLVVALLSPGLLLTVSAVLWACLCTPGVSWGRRLAAPGAPLLPRLARHFAVAASGSSAT
jgi:hypothetical protein